MSRQLAHEGYCGWLQTKALMKVLIASCSLQLWRAVEHHRDAEKTVASDNDAAFGPGLKSFCVLEEIFTVIPLCASMSQWQK